MGFVFSEVFWGVFLIILGISIVIKVVFNINVPLVRILFSFFLIYLGIRILMGGFGVEKPKNMVLFDNQELKPARAADNYNIVFGRGMIDLSNIPMGQGVTKIEVNTVFAEGIIKTNPAVPTVIIVNSVFAGARLPDGNVATFGKYTYKSAGFKEAPNYLEIEANVVFGGLQIVNH